MFARVLTFRTPTAFTWILQRLADPVGCDRTYFFAPAFRRSAQYFRIRSAAAFLAARDIRRRFLGDDVVAVRACAVAPGAEALRVALIFAQRAFCAAAIAARPAAEMVRRPPEPPFELRLGRPRRRPSVRVPNSALIATISRCTSSRRT